MRYKNYAKQVNMIQPQEKITQSLSCISTTGSNDLTNMTKESPIVTPNDLNWRCPPFPLDMKYSIPHSTKYLISIASIMINLQFKTNSLKIGSSVPSISLNYGRNLAKKPNDGSGKGNSCRLFVKRGKECMQRQTEILSK